MHKITRECDEYVCSCGLRWGTDELDPHVVTPSQPTDNGKFYQQNHVEDNKDWK